MDSRALKEVKQVTPRAVCLHVVGENREHEESRI